jgi:hypothetical protein
MIGLLAQDLSIDIARLFDAAFAMKSQPRGEQ